MASEISDRLIGGSALQGLEPHASVEPLLDARGAAAILNVPASWVLAEARADRIPHVRLGRYVLGRDFEPRRGFRRTSPIG